MLRVRTYTSLEALPAAHVRLFDQAEERSFCLGMRWLRNYAEHVLGPAGTLRVVAAETEDGTPQAAIALQQRARTLTSASNYYTSLFAPVLDPAADADAALGTLVRALAAERPRWERIDLSPLDPDAPSFVALATALQRAGLWVQRYFCFGNWILPVAGRSFAQYREALPSAMANTLRRKAKKLEQHAEVRIEIVSGGPELEPALLAYRKVYDASWKIPEPFPQFIDGLARGASAAGWLRLGLVHLGTEPIAAQLWIVSHGTASIFKLAYDERHQQLSAGTVLTARLLERALDVDRVHTVDYLSGDDAYKRTWMSQRRERWGLLAVDPRTPRGLWLAVRHFGGRAVKRALRRGQSTG